MSLKKEVTLRCDRCDDLLFRDTDGTVHENEPTWYIQADLKYHTDEEKESQTVKHLTLCGTCAGLIGLPHMKTKGAKHNG